MTIDEIKLCRLVNQHLVIPTDKKTVVQDLMGVQAQFMSNAMHALRIRCTDYEDLAVEENLIKSWTVRGTVHVFAREDLPLFIRANGGQDYRKNQWNGRRFWNARDQWALTPDRQCYFSEVILSALQSGSQTREELKLLCRDEGMTTPEEDSMFDPWGGGIRELCERGFLSYTVEEEKRFCLLPSYTPMTEEAAEREMARRYFTCYGPATVHDAMYYFHATAAKVKTWLSNLPVTSFECGGKTYYFIKTNKNYDQNLPKCLFLAGFDPLMLGYEKKESLYLAGENLRAIFNLAGIVMPAILLDGQVVARYKKKDKKLRMEPFRALSATEQSILRAKAEALWPELTKIEFAE